MKIRKAELKDLSRIAEIFVFNNRINYFPIFHEEAYSFGEMQVVPMIDQYFKKEEILNRIYVYDDGIIRGFTEINGTEICKQTIRRSMSAEQRSRPRADYLCN